MLHRHQKIPGQKRHSPGVERPWRLTVLAWLMCGACAPAFAANSITDLSSLSIEELADIEISSVSKKAEPLSDAPAAIYVITNDDIRRSGVTSLPEALRLAPNLEVARTDAGNYTISARGFNVNNANKLLVLIDGRTVYTLLHSGVFWDVQDVMLEDVDRIEVISGPGGTLWGSNAVNGVINILTRSSKDTQGALVALGGGNKEQRLAARYGGKLGEDGSFRLYAKGDDVDSTRTAAGTERQDDWRKKQAGFRADWSQGVNALTVQGDVYDASANQAGTLPDKTLSGGNLLGRWNRTLDNGGLQVQAYYDRTKRILPGSFGEVVDTYDVDLQHNFKWGERHDIVWGGGYRLTRDSVTNVTPSFSFLPAERDLKLGNIFIQDTITLTDKLKLTLGEKLEHNSYTGWESQPSARLGWKLNEHSLLWGAVSRAVRTPSRLDRDLFITAPGGRLVGGPDFQSERLTAYELGYRSQPTPKLSYSVATFYNDYDQLRSIERGPTPGTFVIGNKIEGHTYGVETWGTYQARENWRLSAGYTWLRAQLHFVPGSFRSGDTRIGNDPNYQFSLRSSLNLPHDTEFDLTVRSIGALPSPDVPAYTAVDARFGWHINKQLELSLTGANLFDKGHAESGAAATRSEYQRSFFLKLLWKS